MSFSLSNPFAAAPPKEEAKEEPLVAASSKTENTPLVNGKEAAAGEVSPVTTGLAIFVMIFIAVTKTQLTAFLFSYSNYPTAYSGWSAFVTCLLIGIVFPFVPKMWAVPTRDMLPMLGLIILFTTLDLAGTNIALANLSTALQQSISATNPFITIIIETALYCRIQHWLTYIVVALVVIGTILTTVGQAELNPLGLTFAIVQVFSSACKYAFTHKTFRDFKGQLGALALLFWIDLMMIPIFLVWTLISGEFFNFFGAVDESQSIFWQMTGMPRTTHPHQLVQATARAVQTCLHQF